MKILLVNPPDNLSIIGGGSVFVSTIEPLGLLYIAAVARDAGHAVAVIDAFAERLSAEQLRARIGELRPDITGFSSFTSNGGFLYSFGRQLKKDFPGMPVVFGNVHAGVYAEPYLRNGCCDIVVHGEGEYTFLDILSAFAEKRPWSTVPSVSCIEGGRFITTSEARVVEDISRLPLPARDLVKRELYDIGPISNFRLADAKGGRTSKHMFTSRGCPNRCSFCVVHHDISQRFNPIENVIKEIEVLISEYNTGYVFFMDPLFISDRARVLNLCAEIRRRNLDIRWGCEGHVNCVDPELVKAMEAAGCTDLNFGIESGVQRLLNNVRKGIRLDRVQTAIRTVKENSRIHAMGLFILGLPGETWEDSLQTIDFAKRLPLDMAQFSILTPYPGSPLFNDLRNKGEIDAGIRPDGTIDTAVWDRYSAYISYTGNDMIWTTPGLTSAQLKTLQKKALRSFYFRPGPIINQVRRIRPRHIPTYIKAFIDTFL